MFHYHVNAKTELILLETRHAEELFELTDRNRSYLREWLPWVDAAVTAQQTKDYIELSLKAFAENNGLYCGIVYEGKIAGCISLHYIDWASKRTSIGYWLAESFQGRGIMTDACRALLSYLFEELSLNRAEIRAAPDNRKSRAIPERLHFVNEGTLRQNEWLYDHYVDHVVYSLLKQEWLRCKE